MLIPQITVFCCRFTDLCRKIKWTNRSNLLYTFIDVLWYWYMITNTDLWCVMILIHDNTLLIHYYIASLNSFLNKQKLAHETWPKRCPFSPLCVPSASTNISRDRPVSKRWTSSWGKYPLVNWHNYGKSALLMGKLAINGHFPVRKLLVYQFYPPYCLLSGPSQGSLHLTFPADDRSGW